MATIKDKESLSKIENLENADFLVVEHAEKLREGTSLINLAWRQGGRWRELLNDITNRGFYLYMVKDQLKSCFVQHKAVSKLWSKVRSGEFSISDSGVIYTYEPPALADVPPNLLVIFSSMTESIFSPFLMRYFAQNFSSIKKYVPENTAILRIADIGGVTGAFYLNTNYLDRNEENIQSLISEIARRISATKVVLYGGSKGGTGAFYHSLAGGYSSVCVEPIISDDYYFRLRNDLHLIDGIFPFSKQEKFSELLECSSSRDIDSDIIYSHASPQIEYIKPMLLERYPGRFSYFNSMHPEISDHPDVSRKTIHLVTSLINFKLLGVPRLRGNYNIV